MGYYIKWEENGKEVEKSYDSKAGLLYRRKAVIKNADMAEDLCSQNENQTKQP